jgi:hypothetical protein
MSLSDIEKKLSEARLAHLSDDELTTYAGGEVAAITSARVKIHLGLCLVCERRLAVLREESSYLKGEVPAAAMSEMVKESELNPRNHTLGPAWRGQTPAAKSSAARLWARLATALRGVALTPDLTDGARLNDAYPLAAEGGRNWEYNQTEDGSLRWGVGEDGEGNRHVTVASPVTAFEGRKLRLRAGDWQREVVLRRVAPGQVGAEAIITRDEIDRVSTGTAVYLELLDDDQDGGGSE